MIDERQQELCSLYALDLLEGADRTQFEAELAGNAELRSLVDQLRGTAAALAHTAPLMTPPAELKARILASTETSAKPETTIGAVVTFPRLAERGLPWAIAACFAVGCVWLGGSYITSRTEATALRQQQALAELALKSAQAQIEAEQIVATQVVTDYRTLKSDAARQLAESEKRAAEAQHEVVALNQQLKSEADLARLKITTLASMLHNSPQAMAVAVWDPKQQAGLFTVEQLPANNADQRYELWVIDSKPVSAGVFTVGPDGRARVQFKPTAPVARAAKFAVSREKNDGLRSHAAPTEVVMMSE